MAKRTITYTTPDGITHSYTSTAVKAKVAGVAIRWTQEATDAMEANRARELAEEVAAGDRTQAEAEQHLAQMAAANEGRRQWGLLSEHHTEAAAAARLRSYADARWELAPIEVNDPAAAA